MTQLRELGAGLCILAVVMAVAYGATKRSDTMKIKGLPQMFYRESSPELFEARTKTTLWVAIIAFMLGLALLVFAPQP